MENNIFKKIWAAGLAEEAAAKRLESDAAVNDAYASAMENCGGAERSPLMYAAHIQAAARKRQQAHEIRNGKDFEIQPFENINLA